MKKMTAILSLLFISSTVFANKNALVSSCVCDLKSSNYSEILLNVSDLKIVYTNQSSGKIETTVVSSYTTPVGYSDKYQAKTICEEAKITLDICQGK